MSTPLSDAQFDELLREVLSRVQGVLDEQERLRLLLDAVVTMAADLTLDGVLSRLVAIASTLIEAQYAALGVLSDGPGKRLRTFIHHGIDAEKQAEIGDLPAGHGLLGLIIDRPEPLRLHDIAAHPASYGFPEHHPPMSSFLGVPVRIRGRVFGNLYLTEKIGGSDFTDEDENVAIALAAAAGVAIENARLYEEAARRERWLAATADLTRFLTAGEGDEHALRAIAERAREVADSDLAWVVTTDETGESSLRAMVGECPELLEASDLVADLTATVMRTGRPMSVEDLGLGAEQSAGARGGPAMLVPIESAPGGGGGGALGLAWTTENEHDHHVLDIALPARFAEQAALALRVARSRNDQQRLALLQDRDRIGRDLHDLVIQRLFAVGLGLQGAVRLAVRPEVTERLEQAVDDLDATIKDIRRSIFELGSSESSADIQSEVGKLVERAAATLKFRPTLEIRGPVRTLVDESLAPDVLAVLGEALSNAGRHAEASAVDVLLSAEGGHVELVVTDDGLGFPAEVAESGVRNMRERAEAHGGRLEIGSAAEGGTVVSWRVPTQASARG